MKEAESELCNWGRFVHDGWLRDHLLYQPPPTSEGYVTPPYDDPEPVMYPIDHIAGQMTEDIIVQLGLHDFDSYRVLAHWYPRLMMLRFEGTELSFSEMIKRLAKHMRTSYPGAVRMRERAISGYWASRQAALDKREVHG